MNGKKARACRLIAWRQNSRNRDIKRQYTAGDETVVQVASIITRQKMTRSNFK